jgi:hypothetical protein
MRGPGIPTKAAFALAQSEALGNLDPVYPRSEPAGAVVDEHDAFSAEDGRQPDSTSSAPLRSRRYGPLTGPLTEFVGSLCVIFVSRSANGPLSRAEALVSGLYS